MAALAVVGAMGGVAWGQTSGSAALAGSTTWSAAPWILSGGTGANPNDGGTATVSLAPAITPGTLFSTATLSLDTPTTLSQITFNGAVTLLSSSATPFNFSGSGIAVDVEQSGTFNSPVIFGAIGAGGTSGLTKVGAGDLVFGGTNSYTGGTHIDGGRLILNVLGTTESALGAPGPGNGLTFNGGTLAIQDTSSLNLNRDIVLNAGGGKFEVGAGPATAGPVLNGVISGSGALSFSVATSFATAGSLTLMATNTYGGATTIRPVGNPTLIIRGNGAVAASSSYDFAGAVTLNNSSASVNDRLSDSAPLLLRGVDFTLVGSPTTPIDEHVGAAALSAGTTAIAIVTSTTGAQPTSLTLADVTRTNFATLFVHGSNQGTVSNPDGSTAITYGILAPTAQPTLIGGTGGTGSTAIPIVPWGVGANTAVVSSFIQGLSLLTYTRSGGFRPLDTNEYATSLGVNPTDNVRLTGATTVPTNVTANALLFAPSTNVAVGGSGTVNVTSGTVLYSPTTNTIPNTTTPTGTISVGLNFGSAEGVVTASNTLGLTSPISGTGGVTYASPSEAATYIPMVELYDSTTSVAPASSYTGDTRIVSGSVAFRGTVPDIGNNSPFGRDGAIVLAGSTHGATLIAMAASTLSRDIRVTGSGLNEIMSRADDPVVFNGGLTLDGDGYAIGNGLGSLTFNGNIAGAGALHMAGPLFVLTGDNSFSGGTIVGSPIPGGSITTQYVVGATVVAGSDSAFGTGPITFGSYVATMAISGLGAAPRTLLNHLVLNGIASTFSGSAPLTFTGSVSLEGPGTVTVTNTATTTFAGIVSNGGINKAGAGVLALSSPTGNIYSEGTIVSAGTLRVNNASGSGTGLGGVLVAAGATLGGNGTIAGDVSVASGATITAGPDNSTPGTLTTGRETWAGNASGGGLAIKVTATGNDRLVMSGLTISGTGAAPFLVAATGAVPLLIGQQLIIATDMNTASPSSTNPFAEALATGSLALNVPGTTVSTGPGQTLALQAGGDANGYELYLVSTPEPTSLGLLTASAAAALASRRRRSTAAKV